MLLRNFAHSKITNFSVFFSSKLLNLVFIGFTLLIFRKLFDKDAYLYGLIFLFSSYLEIYSFTWSETGFIFGLVMYLLKINLKIPLNIRLT